MYGLLRHNRKEHGNYYNGVCTKVIIGYIWVILE